MDLLGLDFTSTDTGAWQRGDGERLVGSAGARTDLFVDPVTGAPTINAPVLLTPAPAGDFQLSARVQVPFRSTYDAACLVVWGDETTWGKLCFEYSPQGVGMAVSVITRGVSDDANGFLVDGNVLWLRISRASGAYAFHASTDGGYWHFVRHFRLDTPQPRIGFEVQSPLGESLTASFSDLRYAETTLADLRDGS